MEKILKKLDGKNRIVLPTEILDELKVKSGDYVILKLNNGKIQIVRANITEG